MRAQDVMEQGYDEIQHINQVMLNFFVTPETDTRTLQRFYLVADKTAESKTLLTARVSGKRHSRPCPARSPPSASAGSLSDDTPCVPG